jgi:hypothetical protein
MFCSLRLFAQTLYLKRCQVPIIANPTEWSVLKSVVASYHLAPRYDISRDTSNTDTQISVRVMPSHMNAASCVAQERISNGFRSPDVAARTAGIGFSFSVACKDVFSNEIGKSAFYKSATTSLNPDDVYHSNSIVGSTSYQTFAHSVQRGAGVNSGIWHVVIPQQEMAGVYSIFVMTSGGAHVASSPFQVSVFPSIHCATRSTVSGTFLSIYAANNFCTFSVIARDRFYNKLTTGQ